MMHTLSAQQTSINPNYKMFQPSPKTWQKRTGKSRSEFKGENMKNMFTPYDDFVDKMLVRRILFGLNLVFKAGQKNVLTVRRFSQYRSLLIEPISRVTQIMWNLQSHF